MLWWAISSRCLTTRSSSQITKEPIRNMPSPNLSLKLWMTHTIRSSPTLHSNWHQDMWAPSWLLRIINAHTMSTKLSQIKPRLAIFAETSPSAAWITLSFSLVHSISETSNRNKNSWLPLGWTILRWGYCWMSQYLHLLGLSLRTRLSLSMIFSTVLAQTQPVVMMSLLPYNGDNPLFH
jgi:hypothetical protein